MRVLLGTALVALLVVLAVPAGAASAMRCDLRGGSGADRLLGGWAADRICGMAGRDKLFGEHHDDRLAGGSGDDYLNGGTGNDRLDGGPGDDTVGDPYDFAAERGDDRLTGGPGVDRIHAGQGDDTAFGDDGDDVIRMGFGDDRTAVGGPGNDRIFGENGNDGTRTPDGGLYGGAGDDLVMGGPGDDRLLGDHWGAEAPGHDVLFGGGGQDLIEGGAGDDFLVGGKGGDRIDGGPGHDVLVGNSGADALLGGDGDDLVWAVDFQPNSTTLIVDGEFSAPSDAQVDCGAGNDLVVVDLQDRRDIAITGCEEIVVLRSERSYCSPISRWLAGGPRKATLLDLGVYPQNPNRVLQTPSPFAEKPAFPVDEESMKHCAQYTERFLLDPSDDQRPNVKGTEGPDVLGAAGAIADGFGDLRAALPATAAIFNALAGDDVVTGTEGRDTILGGAGDDTIRGLGGDDGSLEGETGDDSVWGGDGDDLVFGRTGADLLWGEAGNDYLEGGRGADGLSGGPGNDSLFGGFDRDRLKGGEGDDHLFAYDDARDLVDCGPGNDVAEVDRRDIVRGCERVVRPGTKARRVTRR